MFEQYKQFVAQAAAKKKKRLKAESDKNAKQWKRSCAESTKQAEANMRTGLTKM